MEVTSLSNTFWASPQIFETDLADLAKDGYTDVIYHRPDDERPKGPIHTIRDIAATQLHVFIGSIG